jgi:hypothetical protein
LSSIEGVISAVCLILLILKKLKGFSLPSKLGVCHVIKTNGNPKVKISIFRNVCLPIVFQWNKMRRCY